jgi:hypothetical protein
LRGGGALWFDVPAPPVHFQHSGVPDEDTGKQGESKSKNEKKNSDNNKNKRRQSLKSVSFERLVD